ncbi:MAG: amino acid adenylation domain-containing protein [Anaerolineae bacterium]|nr:amino acid adenylation domain-containing protein [Anaerolineae bacterium]
MSEAFTPMPGQQVKSVDSPAGSPCSRSGSALADGAQRADPANVYPLSYGQRALWYLQKVDPDYAAYTIARAVRLVSDVDVNVLRRAFQSLVDRHRVFRTTFHASQGEPLQRIHPQMQAGFYHHDARTWTEFELDQHLAEEIYRPFDLEQGPLMRVHLFARPDGHPIVLLSIHHIVSDLWSFALLLAELGKLYSEHQCGVPANLKPPRAEYTDFVQGQSELVAGPQGAAALQYWKAKLAGELSPLNLPTDWPRPARQTFRGTSQFRFLSSELTQGLKDLARGLGVRVDLVLLAAFQALLMRYTGQDDLLVGIPKANRTPSQARTQGYFVNPVAIRTDLSDDPTFADLVARVAQAEDEAREHDAYPFALLVEHLQPERDASRSPIFQVMFAWQKTTRVVDAEALAAFSLGGAGGQMALGDDLLMESLAVERQVSPFELTLWATEAGDRIAVSLEYNTQLFAASTARRMLEHLSVLLESGMTAPGQRVSDLCMLTPLERHRLVHEWNATGWDATCPSSIVQQIEEQVARTPEAVAALCDSAQLTYRQLNRRANQLARHLQRLGVRLGTPVGVCVERSLDAVVALLATLKSGGVYVPLDPSYPQERLSFMREDAGVALLLTERGLAGILPSDGVPLVCIDEDRDTMGQESDQRPEVSVSAECRACIIYTSGSTGRPKGVVLSHGALARHGLDIRRHYGLDAHDRVLQFASLSFDQSIEQILPTLAAGAGVVMRGAETWSPAEFNARVREAAITVANLPTAYWHQLTAEWQRAPDTAPADQLQLVIPGGDRVRPEILRLWQQSPMRKVRLLNAYGPTETTVTATTYEVPMEPIRELANVPIGRALAHRTLYILDPKGEPAPIGVPGELYIGGSGLAEGYLNQPELTADRFVPDALSVSPGARLYRTGDQACYLPDGTIEFLGRMDYQVKIRGFRIELGEIETALGGHPQVKQAVVQIGEDEAGSKFLVAYLVPRDGATPDTAEIRQFLRERLPEYMLPSALVMMEQMPLTPSGKIDRRRLPAPARVRDGSAESFVAPRTPIEQEVAAVWTEVLGLERIGIHDDFFDLGGHSLLATQLCARLSDTFGLEVPLRSLFEAPTVAGLCESIVALQISQTDDAEIAALLAELEQLSDEEAQNLLGSPSQDFQHGADGELI